MPSTLLGLLVFVISLAPGLTFVLARQRVVPQQSMSVFRETAQMVCVSLLLDIVALLIFGLIRLIWPGGTPDVDRIVREPGSYLRESYLLVAWWALGLLAVAVLLAWLAGSGLLRRILSRAPGLRVDAEVMPHESSASAWWLLFREQPGRRVHVGCNLEDGSFVSGWLASYNTAIDEDADRELTLAAPIRYRPKGAADSAELTNTSAVVVSARRIALLLVSYQAPASREP
ncbi:DUF6338 family protein [Saccharopolyspora phatthalungensis]|uniref:Uncharacterized protein n=1 Tax=Saccharopolyspora phatthalungensis TaxID=664693 RepID=A0A840Q2B7_9PSEU|nr:DUF6338 family protein [Saccharopolyspora phatthalungensis]MBB5152869.1 hypothetical protein [Saccharopolyspora phatthalungensis]